MRVAVVGTGYVGLVVGAGLADTGNDVTCVDIDENKIGRLNRGEIPIYEPGLDKLVERNLEDGRLKFTTDVPAAVRDAQVIFIAVGTPPGEDGSADLQHVLAVAETIGRSMSDEKVVVTKSTVPVGTAARVRAVIREHTDLPVHVCSNPEFLKEGAAVDDFMKPDRVVIGVDSEYSRKVLGELYAPFVRTGNPILFMDVASAEITKYAANAMLATRISFMNMIARLCDDVGADVSLVRQGVGSDERIGNSFLFAGAGYGGSCFPKDVKALIRTLADRGLDSGILDAVERVNEEQKQALLRMIDAAFPDGLDGRRFGVWGLSFKPETDDMREAPSIVVIEGLLERGAQVTAHDPEAIAVARGVFGDRIGYADNNYDALADADALVIITEWKQYRQPDFERIRSMLRQPLVFDGRNLFNPDRMLELGFEYVSIGRPRARPAGRVAAPLI
ncbi:MAG TPA: UDP-glucose/GDP-mannose dehydrogenase family protein [Longimicrobiales bacterium]|nr:UDP-glucose/GDP-mannose dehydrogenase family protein [Longimicrobiales bacterium]